MSINYCDYPAYKLLLRGWYNANLIFRHSWIPRHIDHIWNPSHENDSLLGFELIKYIYSLTLLMKVETPNLKMYFVIIFLYITKCTELTLLKIIIMDT